MTSTFPSIRDQNSSCFMVGKDCIEPVSYHESDGHSEDVHEQNFSSILKGQGGTKSVKFGGLIIREHEVEISNLPWRNGPPVTLSWNLICEYHFDLDAFEQYRVPERRPSKALLTIAEDRRQLLKEHCGYSDEDLYQAELIKRKRSIPSRSSRVRLLS